MKQCQTSTWMDPKIIIFSEVRQRQMSYNTTYMWDLKKNTNQIIYKTEIESQMQKTNLWLPKGSGKERINWEIGMDIYTLLHIKQVTNKDLLQSIGNFTQYSVMTYMGKESKKQWIYLYV